MTPDKLIEDKLLAEYLNLDYDVVKNYPFVDHFKTISEEEKLNPVLQMLRILSDPSNLFFAAKNIFNVELPPFQLVVMEELWNRKYPMLVATRGFSKSFLLGLYAIMRAFFHQGCKIIVVGAAFRQAKVVYEYAERIWNNAPILRDLCGTGKRVGPRRDIDRCSIIVGDSEIIALPLGTGEKIRGQRAHYIISDEFGAINREIYETVISGFAAVTATPVESLKREAKKRFLAKQGMSAQEDDSLLDKGFVGNQSILAGTAGFDFEHFAGYWKRYRNIIESRGDKNKLEEIFNGEVPEDFNWRDYSIMRIPVELMPAGFMDKDHIARARATIDSGIYNNEYAACFSKDSMGFFKRSLIESCVAKPVILGDGTSVKFSALLQGISKFKYVMAVDPASESDNFSIVVLEIHENHRRVVYCWTTTRKGHMAKVKDGIVKDNDYYAYCARKIRDTRKIFPCDDIAIDSQGGGYAVLEALHNINNILPGELMIWPVVLEDKEQESDMQPGLHIVNMINFSDANYTRDANHGLRNDMQNKVLLFPFFDGISIAMALEEDKILKRKYDTLEDAMMEIEEMKVELTTIQHTLTMNGRDRWDTPETKLAGNKKGRLRKDRYSALVMANMLARQKFLALKQVTFDYTGGFAGKIEKAGGNLYNGPDWFVQGLKAHQGHFGHVVNRNK